MDELHGYAERRMRAAIRRVPEGRYQASDVVEELEGEAEIRATVTVRGDGVQVDFEGTAEQRPGNLNCPLSVTRSAVYYVVRVVCAPDLEASGGAFVPVQVRAPEGCLVNARFPAAVVAGNTETSSRIVDVVMAAFGQALPVPAMGQGTMNNTVIGNERFTYYETIGGGQGACPDGEGPSAVHVAMSNTLNTPIEALEREYPLRIERYALRPGKRRGRPSPRRRRSDQGDAGARGLPAVAADRAPQARAQGSGRRRRRCAGREPAERPPDRGQAQPRAARGRPAGDPHARRRRVRPPPA